MIAPPRSDPPPPRPAASNRPHRAALLEDALNATVARRLIRRGWVPQIVGHPGYGAPGWVRILGRALLAPPGTSEAEAAEKGARSERRTVRGWRSFITVKCPGAVVRVTVAGVTTTVRAERGGYVDAVVPCDLAPGAHEATLEVAGHRTSVGLQVIDPTAPVGLITDVDDTVWVTALPRPVLAAWNSFVLHQDARRPVPGMAELFARWLRANPGAPVFYLSTGAWNVAPTLQRFLRRHGYPRGTFLLTDWGPTNTGWFRSGQAHKRASLRTLAEQFPDTRWLLVGDDGQHDPQIYAEAAERYPDSVLAVAIRELSPAQQVLSHGTLAPLPRPAEEGAGPVRVHGADGHEITLRLLDAGLL